MGLDVVLGSFGGCFRGCKARILQGYSFCGVISPDTAATATLRHSHAEEGRRSAGIVGGVIMSNAGIITGYCRETRFAGDACAAACRIKTLG